MKKLRSRESKVRRKLKKLDLRLIKSRVKKPNINNCGFYQIVDFNNIVVDGEFFDKSLETIEKNLKARIKLLKEHPHFELFGSGFFGLWL
jgi:ubiquinone biosynthesis protein Coq4